MCKKKRNNTNEDVAEIQAIAETVSAENRIALMAVLRDEWKYRDQTFFLYFWRFIYLSLVVTFLPAFLKATHMEIAIIEKLPLWLFSIFGIMFSGFGMYIGLASTERMKNVNDAYGRFLKTFSAGCAPRSLKKSIFKPSLNRLLCIVSYSSMIALAVINIIVTI